MKALTRIVSVYLVFCLTTSVESFAQQFTIYQTAKERRKATIPTGPETNGVLQQNERQPRARNQYLISRTSSVNPVPIGSSDNVFDVTRPEQNQVYANDSLGLVMFIHRNDGNISSGDIGNLRFDYSTDSGLNWTKNEGTIVSSTNFQTQARYPNICGFELPGNTDPPQVKMVYSSPIKNLSTGWEGQVNGIWDLDTPSPRTENYAFNGSGAYLQGGLCEGLPGEFWTVDFKYGGVFSGPELYVYKGTYDAGLEDIVWVRKDTLVPAHYTAFNGKPQIYGPNISFSPDGMTGWIAWLGDLQGGTETTLAPCLIKSTDGGATWGPGFYEFDYDLIPWVSDSLQSVWIDSFNNPISTGEATSGYDFDLIVDYNGNPHVAHVVGSRTLTIPSSNIPDYSFQTTTAKFLADVFSTDGGNTWDIVYLSPVLTFRSPMFGSIPSVYMDNYCQVARNSTGEIIFYSWADSDTAQVTGSMNGIGFGEPENRAPNLRICARNVDTKEQTYPKLVTDGDLDWQGLIYYPTMAPEVLTSDTGYCLPIVFSEFSNPNGQTFHHYLGNDAKIGKADFLDPKDMVLWWDVISSTPQTNVFAQEIEAAAFTIAPNPFVESFGVQFTIEKPAILRWSISSMEGKILYSTETGMKGAGTHIIDIDLHDLPRGVYLFEMWANDRISRKKLVKN